MRWRWSSGFTTAAAWSVAKVHCGARNAASFGVHGGIAHEVGIGNFEHLEAFDAAEHFQRFIAVGAERLGHLDGGGVGFGGEAAMGNKVVITLDGVPVPTETDSKPFFAILFGGIGADVALPFSKSFYFVPDARVGTIISTKPVTLYVESFLGLAYQF